MWPIGLKETPPAVCWPLNNTAASMD
jgi:hypothetical protein